MQEGQQPTSDHQDSTTFNGALQEALTQALAQKGNTTMTNTQAQAQAQTPVTTSTVVVAEAPRSTLMSRISNMGDVTQHSINRITREVENNLESYLRRCDEKAKARDETVSYSFGLSMKQVTFAKQICEGLRDQGARVTLRRFSDLEREGRNALRTHVVVTVPVPKKA